MLFLKEMIVIYLQAWKSSVSTFILLTNECLPCSSLQKSCCWRTFFRKGSKVFLDSRWSPILSRLWPQSIKGSLIQTIVLIVETRLAWLPYRLSEVGKWNWGVWNPEKSVRERKERERKRDFYFEVQFEAYQSLNFPFLFPILFLQLAINPKAKLSFGPYLALSIPNLIMPQGVSSNV